MMRDKEQLLKETRTHHKASPPHPTAGTHNTIHTTSRNSTDIGNSIRFAAKLVDWRYDNTFRMRVCVYRLARSTQTKLISVVFEHFGELVFPSLQRSLGFSHTPTQTQILSSGNSFICFVPYAHSPFCKNTRVNQVQHLLITQQIRTHIEKQKQQQKQ